METIDIALASDAAYFPGLLVTAASLARAASRGVKLRFNVLDGGIGEENVSLLRERLSLEHPHAELRTFPVDDDIFKSLRAWNGTGRMAYARLLLPGLLSEVEFAIYCDVDFLWTADVAELWKLRDGSVPLQACRESSAATLVREERWFAANGISFDRSRYVCTGLMIMNLRLFRERGISESLMDFLAAHGDVQYVDQTAVNAIVGDIVALPGRWGVFAWQYDADAAGEGCAIHFAGSAPWRHAWWTRALTDAHVLWYRLYGEIVGMGWRAARRRFIPLGQIVARRATWIVVRHAALRLPFFMLLRLLRRGCYIPELKEMAK